MSDDAASWPNFADELGRKSTDVIDRWMKQYEAGHLSLREFFLIVTAVYDTTSGLAPRDISTMMATIHEELRNEAARRKTENANL